MSKQNKIAAVAAVVGTKVAAKPAGKEDRHFVTALARGLSVLSCFSSGEKLLGNMDIARRCKLPKSTVSRLTYTLTKLGYLVFVEESGKYRLGTSTLALGSAMLARLDVRDLSRPLMQDLADFSRSMVSLGSRDRLSMIYVGNARSSAALTLSLDVGSRIPIATTAMGRAYLALASEREREDILERVRELDEVAWPAIRNGIERALKEYRETGCVSSFGEWQTDVNAIAVPLRPGGGLPPMAINCGGPAFNLSKEFLLGEVRPRLIALVTQLEASLGMRP
ncbi:MAG: IclR family transcriptional regulator [Rhodocyclaceae bacterium]|nr:MAG: IclR family transcriptional regulator [Rhodocyclaceae bacterium]